MARIYVPLDGLHVLFPIYHLHTLHMLIYPLIIFQLEKLSDVSHGLLNVLTKPAGVLQVTQTRRETDHWAWTEVGSRWIYNRKKLSFGSLTVSGLENLLEMWNVMRFSPIMI